MDVIKSNDTLGAAEGDDGLSEADSTWKSDHKDRMLALFETGVNSDVTLIVGPQKVPVRVHGVIVAAGSPKFKKMLKELDKLSGSSSLFDLVSSLLDASSIANSIDLQTIDMLKSIHFQNELVSLRMTVKELIIENVNPKYFKLFLKHLYTGNSGAEMDAALPLLHIASDYEVKDLMKQCAELLKGEITDQNALLLFEQAMEFAYPEIIKSSLDYICKNVTKLLQRDQFADLPLHCLIEILMKDELCVNNELEIFFAAMSWGEAECKRQNLDPQIPKNMRDVLNNVLAYIRFPNIDGEEFALNVAERSVLDNQELITLLIIFLVRPSKRSQIRSGRFISKPRNYINDVKKRNDCLFCSAKIESDDNKERPLTCKGSRHTLSRRDTPKFPLYAISNSKVLPSPRRCEKLLFRADKPVWLSGFKCMKKILGIFEKDDPGANVYSNAFVELVIKIWALSNLKEWITKIEGKFNFETVFSTPIKLEENEQYKLEIHFKGKLFHRLKTLDNFSYTTDLSSQDLPHHLVVGTGYSATQQITAANANGEMETINFEFSREASDTTMSINEGFIKELFVHLY